MKNQNFFAEDDAKSAISRRIGNNLGALREKSGLNAEQVAIKLQLEGCDVTRSEVVKAEAGQRIISVEELLLLKDIFKASYADILD